MNKEIIKTDKAPKAIGPYSQAIKYENLMFISGQIPVNPATGEIIGDIKTQTRQVLENIKSILLAANASTANIIKTTVFLKNLDDFKPMNEIYAEYFEHNAPARSTVGVLQIPRGALVEIEAIAIVDKNK